MTTLTTETSLPAESPPQAKPKRTRRFKKRAHFKQVPRMPLPVRSLWKAASEEEKKRAHETSVVMLEHWLGRISRDEAASKLQLSPLRLWQLSQQALAGMVAGLLKQPRPRKPTAEDSGDEPTMLKRRVVQLEKELARSQDLLRLLRELPAHRESKPASSEAKDARKRKTKAANRRRPAKEDRRAAPERPG